MQMLMSQWRRRRKEAGLFVLGMAAAYLLVVILFSVIVREKGGAQTVFPVGTVFAVVTGMTAQLITCSYCITYEFNLAVSMGVTRKRIVSGYGLFSLLELFGIYVCTLVFCGLESVVYRLSMPGSHMAEEIRYLFDARYVCVVIFGILELEMLIGALVLRFGMRIFWAIWLFFMIVGILPKWRGMQRVLLTAADGVRNLFESIGPAGPWLAAGAAELFCLLVSYRMLKKQRVTI